MSSLAFHARWGLIDAYTENKMVASLTQLLANRILRETSLEKKVLNGGSVGSMMFTAINWNFRVSLVVL